jgi:VanZ family protein
VFQRKYSNRYRLLRVVNIHPAMTGKHDPTMGGKGIADIDTVQHFVPGRAFQLNDLALDLAAALAGAAALLLIRRLVPVREHPFRPWLRR